MDTMQFAYHGLTWGLDGFRKSAEDISAAGYRGFETFGELYDMYKDKRPELKSILNDLGLQLVTLYGGGSLNDPDKIESEIERNIRIAEFLKEFDCDIMVLGGGLRTLNGKDASLELAVETCNKIGEKCKKTGVTPCLHPHLWTRFQDRDELSAFMDLTDPEYVSLCPDTAHLLYGGSDPVEVFSTYINRIKHVHIKDINVNVFKNYIIEEFPEPGVHLFSEIGEGTINFPAVFQILKKNNYSGWVTVELDSTDKDPFECAKISAEYIKDVLKHNL